MPDSTNTASATDVANSLGLSTSDYGKSVGGAVSDIESLAKQQSSVMDRLLSKQEQAIEKGEKESEDAYKNITPFKPLPPPDQRQYQTDPLQSFFSLGSVFGILASAFTHQPWTTSMDAATAAINARNQSDAAAYDHAFQSWKENTDLMFKRHQVQMEDWKTINENTKENLGLRDALMKGYEAKYGDQIAATYRAAGLYGQLEEIMAKRQATNEKMEADYPKVVTGGLIRGYLTAKNSGNDDLANKYLGELTEISKSTKAQTPLNEAIALRVEASQMSDKDPRKAQLLSQADQIDSAVATSKTGQTPNVISDDTADLIANRILAGDATATRNMSRNAANMTKVGNAIEKIAKEKGLAPQDIMVAQASVKADQTSLNSLQKMTDAAISFEKTAEANFDLALKAAPDAVPDLGPWINKWVETGETGVGDPSVPKYVTYLLTGANEYAKIMAGSTGAQGSTVDSRNEAREIFSPYMNTGQINAVVKAARNDMKNRQNKLEGQLVDIKDRMKSEGTGSSSPLSSLAKEAWGNYQPDKYDYRIDPDTGNIQRRLK